MKKFFSCVLTLILITALCGCNIQGGYFERGETVFLNSEIALNVKLMGGDEEAAYNEMVVFLKNLDAEISLSREDSLIYKFNDNSRTLQATGEIKNDSVEVSAAVYEMIDFSKTAEAATGGAFSLGALPLTELWGLTTDNFRKFGDSGGEPLNLELPGDSDITDALKISGTANLRYYKVCDDESECRYYISRIISDEPQYLDFGAVAKGFALDKCRDIAVKYGVESGYIDLSGNIALIGKELVNGGYTDFKIGIDSPRPRLKVWGNYVIVLPLSGETCIGVSGDYQRYFINSDSLSGNLYLCHIVNAKTGIPAGIERKTGGGYKMQDYAVSSAVILSESGMRTDVFSTCAFLLSGTEGENGFLNNIKTVYGDTAMVFTEKSYSGSGELVGEYEEGAHGTFKSNTGIDPVLTDSYNGYKSYTAVNL